MMMGQCHQPSHRISYRRNVTFQQFATVINPIITTQWASFPCLAPFHCLYTLESENIVRIVAVIIIIIINYC